MDCSTWIWNNLHCVVFYMLWNYNRTTILGIKCVRYHWYINNTEWTCRRYNLLYLGISCFIRCIRNLQHENRWMCEKMAESLVYRIKLLFLFASVIRTIVSTEAKVCYPKCILCDLQILTTSYKRSATKIPIPTFAMLSAPTHGIAITFLYLFSFRVM